MAVTTTCRRDLSMWLALDGVSLCQYGGMPNVLLLKAMPQCVNSIFMLNSLFVEASDSFNHAMELFMNHLMA